MAMNPHTGGELRPELIIQGSQLVQSTEYSPFLKGQILEIREVTMKADITTMKDADQGVDPVIDLGLLLIE